MKKLFFVCIVLLLAAIIISAGCVSTPKDPGTSTLTPTNTPTISEPPTNQMTIAVDKVVSGNAALDEIAIPHQITKYPGEGKTAYLIQVTITCDKLGKNSKALGYANIGTTSYVLQIPSDAYVDDNYVQTIQSSVSEKYDNKMLDGSIKLKEGESITGWILFNNVPVGNATFMLDDYYFSANTVNL